MIFACPKWQIIAVKASLPFFSLWPHRHFTETVARSTTLRDWVASEKGVRYVVIPDDSHNANQDKPDFF